MGVLLILRPAHVALTMFRTIEASGRELDRGSDEPRRSRRDLAEADHHVGG
jgi:hypothetical protein